ncbi:hypothetical protein RRG08_051649 [Elysia crispata]|uniref:Uncharacterized protein n=1 Tax=Elysia crispata TaxID=231223 RepID=A0AAE1A3T6_9GAST|nr:hypothetical protein RRG08_051649 [Elysia crispata]
MIKVRTSEKQEIEKSRSEPSLGYNIIYHIPGGTYGTICVGSSSFFYSIVIILFIAFPETELVILSSLLHLLSVSSIPSFPTLFFLLSIPSRSSSQFGLVSSSQDFNPIELVTANLLGAFSGFVLLQNITQQGQRVPGRAESKAFVR